MVIESGAKQCFIELAKADTSADYEKVLKIANKVLRKYPKETSAFKCKLVALIHLAHLDEALTLIKKTPPSHMGDCVFEKAYVQYRLHDDAAAIDTLAKPSNQDFRCLELKAQLLYRAERFNEAESILRRLLKDHSDEYDEERRANLLATVAQLHANNSPQPFTADCDTFEQFYNAACHQIEAENYSVALIQLEKAEKICGETLAEEGLADEEVEEELSMIRVQKAFVLQKLGRNSEALKIYLRLQNINSSDKSILATVANNIPSARSEMNLLEARKKLKTALQIDSSKLTGRQRRSLALNQALVHLHSNQREPCRRSLAEYVSNYGMCKEVALIEAALSIRFRDVSNALAILEADSSCEAKLSIIQILLDEENLNEACKAADALTSNLSSRPAILQLRIALLLATNQQTKALDLLNLALKEAKSEEVRVTILEELASLNIQCGEYRVAVECLQSLSALRPNDLQILCRLIKAYAAFDPQKAEELSSQVFPEEVTSEFDVDALERSDSILFGERYRQKKEIKTEALNEEIVTGKKRAKKRKRKIILPKNYDPKVQPDPERWLPRQERTAYRKKLNKKHRDRDIGRGTQGAVSGSSSHMEFEAAPKAAPSLVPSVLKDVEGPRQRRPAGQQVKKKKKKPTSKW